MTGPYPPHPDGTPPPAPPFPPSYPAQPYPAQAPYPPPGTPYGAPGTPYAPYAQPGSPYMPPPGMPPFPVQAPPPKSRHGLVIGMFVGAVVLAIVCGAAIVGVVIYRNGHSTATPSGGSPDAAETNDPLTNLIDYRTSNPSWLGRDHQTGEITYPMTPPAGGPHHAAWQNCMGDVYPSPIDNGNAVHSLEHGAVWITYRPGLAKETIEELASRVRGKDYIMMSPYPGQSTPVSLQAWGYQLPLANVYLKQVDTFIARFRKTASVEPGAACSSGETTTTS